MRLKLSCTPISFSEMYKNGQMNNEKFINFCADQQIEAVDLLSYPIFWKNKKSEIKKIGGWLEKAGINLAAYGVGNNFAVSEEGQFKLAVDTVISGIYEASELNAPYLRIFGGYYNPEKMERSEGFKRIFKGIETILSVAEKNGIILALENHGNLPGHSYELEMIVKHFNHQNLKVLLDYANLTANNMDEAEINEIMAIEKLAPYIVHVHMKDWQPAVIDKSRRLEPALVGKGIVPIRQGMAALSSCAYKGYISLEYEASTIISQYEGVIESLRYLKQVRYTIEILSE